MYQKYSVNGYNDLLIELRHSTFGTMPLPNVIAIPRRELKLTGDRIDKTFTVTPRIIKRHEVFVGIIMKSGRKARPRVRSRARIGDRVSLVV